MTLRPLLLACALAPALAFAGDPPAPPPPPAEAAAPAPAEPPAASAPQAAAPAPAPPGAGTPDGAPPAAAPAALAPAPPADAPPGGAPPAAPLPATPPAAPAPPAGPLPAAAVAPPAPPAEPLPAPPPPPPSAAPYPRLGLFLGAGVPQAATLDLLYRPVPWFRLQAGPSWGYAAWGYHGGVVFSPLRWAVSPTLGLDGGRFFDMDLNKVARSASAEAQPLLRRVSVSYLATTLGLEFGSQRGFVFSLRLGLAWLRVDSHGTGRFTNSGGTAGQNSADITVTDPSIRASMPTLQLGFQYFI